jgi:peptidoglycan hydrolase CwlO-like protein
MRSIIKKLCFSLICLATTFSAHSLEKKVVNASMVLDSCNKFPWIKEIRGEEHWKDLTSDQLGQITSLIKQPISEPDTPPEPYKRIIWIRDDNPMSKKDKSISKKDKSISKKDKSISKKDKSISKKDKSISKKDKSISKKDKSISKKDKSISKKDKSISKKNEYFSFCCFRSRSINHLTPKEGTIRPVSRYEKNGVTHCSYVYIYIYIYHGKPNVEVHSFLLTYFPKRTHVLSDGELTKNENIGKRKLDKLNKHIRVGVNNYMDRPLSDCTDLKYLDGLLKGLDGNQRGEKIFEILGAIKEAEGKLEALLSEAEDLQKQEQEVDDLLLEDSQEQNNTNNQDPEPPKDQGDKPQGDKPPKEDQGDKPQGDKPPKEDQGDKPPKEDQGDKPQLNKPKNEKSSTEETSSLTRKPREKKKVNKSKRDLSKKNGTPKEEEKRNTMDSE